VNWLGLAADGAHQTRTVASKPEEGGGEGRERERENANTEYTVVPNVALWHICFVNVSVLDSAANSVRKHYKPQYFCTIDIRNEHVYGYTLAVEIPEFL
jgi:hypothetical protein